MREMKDSGVEYIKKIPRDWKGCKLKNIANIYVGNSIKDMEKDNYLDSSDAYPYISTKDININTLRANYENGMYIKKQLSDFKLAPINSILLCIEGGSAGKKTTLVKQTVAFVNKLCCIEGKSINKLFLYFYIVSPAFSQYFNRHINGLIGGVNRSILKNVYVPLPMHNEQIKIANYLDDKCSKIDEIIANIKLQIKMLNEYQLSLIDELILKENKTGNKCKINYIGTMKNGLNFTDQLEGNEVYFLGVGDFKDFSVLNDVGMYSNIIVNESINDDFLLQSGDIIFVRSNGSKELVGRAVMVENVHYPLTYSGFCIRFRNKRSDIINSKYLLYFFKSLYFRKELEKYSRGSNINNLNQELLSKIQITYPSLDKQVELVKIIEEKNYKIQLALNYKKNLVEKLNEYKKSLIYELVTGKKEV